MSLVLNALPDLHSEIASLRQKLDEKSMRIAELEIELREERAQNAANRASVETLRSVLAPLYQGLQRVFGHMDSMGFSDAAAPVSNAKREVWNSWKEKLGGLTGKAIEVLQLHGPMTQTQLRIQLKCASRSVVNIVAALNKAQLIKKQDGKIALKEL